MKKYIIPCVFCNAEVERSILAPKTVCFDCRKKEKQGFMKKYKEERNTRILSLRTSP